MKRLTLWLSVVATLVVLIAGATAVFASPVDRSGSSLKRFLLSQDEMPTGSRWIDEGRLGPDDPRSVLNSKSPIRTAPYLEGYYAMAVGSVKQQDSHGQPTGADAPAAIIQSAYRYETPNQANEQYSRLASAWAQTAGAEVLRDEGQRFTVQMLGAEGEAVYWSAQVKGSNLILVCVDDMQAFDGQARQSGRQLIDATAEILDRR